MTYPIQVLTKERVRLSTDMTFAEIFDTISEQKGIQDKIDQLNKAIETLTNIENGNI